MEIKESKSGLAVLGMVAGSIIFGTVGIVAPYTGLKAFELVFVRCVSASLILGVIWWGSGQLRREPWNRRDLVRVLLCGLALILNWICLFRAFELLPVTLVYLAPVMVLLAGVPLFGERFGIWSVLSVLACFGGSALIAGLGGGVSLGALLSPGVVWALLTAVLYAALTLLGKGIQKLSPYAVSCMQTLMGVILLPAFVHFGAFSGLSVTNWWAVALMGAVHTGLVYVLFFGSVRKLPTRLISSLVYIDPAVAVVLDMTLNGFRPSSTQWLGIGLMALGLAVTSIASGRSEKTREALASS